MNDVPPPGFVHLPPPRRVAPAQLLAKRAFDLCAAATGLVLLAPLLLVIAAAVWRDSLGPVLFRQVREGYRVSTFTILKFRTMLAREPSGFAQARPNDPRVTRVGAYLRAASFDELPQLFNVLSGRLSLVGPRPHVPALSARWAPLVPFYYERLDVRPGITGLAQVSGLRGETETLARMSARVRLDRAYAHGWTFAGDLAILLRTLSIPLGDDRAY